MDVDDTNDQIDFFPYFNNDTHESFPWCHSLTEQIETRRAQLSGSLIFDILLTTCGVQAPATVFPPSDVESLKTLLKIIANSTFDALKKDCLVYYLLKWHRDGREGTFYYERCIPPHFVLLADAYWHLDTGIQIARAVAILSDARLNRDYVSKTLEALALSETATSLILKYVRTVNPPLSDPADIDIYVTALAESNLWDAWRYQRTLPEDNEQRSRVIEVILHWCLSPKPRSKPLTQLVAIPFSEYEQSLVHEYALHPPPKWPLDSISAIQDLACLRLIQSGQYAAAVKLDRQFALAATRTTPKLKKAAEDRRRMMEEITNALPSVERELLQMELEQLASGKPSAAIFSSSKGASFGSGTNDLNMSWERLTPRPVTNGTLPASVQQPSLFAESPIPERSALRRFGMSDAFSGRPGSDLRLSQVSQGIQASMTTAQPHHIAAASPMLHSTPRFSALHDPSRFPASSSSGPSGLRFTPNRPGAGLFDTHHATQAGRTPMDDSATSANFARNAFYDPPATNGVKRPFDHGESRLAPTIPTQPSPPPPPSSPPQPTHSRHDDDIDMFSEGDSGLRDDIQNPINGTDAPTATEHPFSIFTQTSKADATLRQHDRTEAQRKRPPGAFGPESDEEGIAEKTRKSKDRTTRVSSPPSKTQPSRTTKSRKSTKSTNPSRTIPGALMAEEEEDEEEDQIGPLPSSTEGKKPARKGRISRTSSITGDQGESKAPRRSSRLMTAPSTASSSPEPQPRKPEKRSTRGSATTATTSKSNSRKKR